MVDFITKYCVQKEVRTPAKRFQSVPAAMCRVRCICFNSYFLHYQLSIKKPDIHKNFITFVASNLIINQIEL
jgi:hypothetical protein